MAHAQIPSLSLGTSPGYSFSLLQCLGELLYTAGNDGGQVNNENLPVSLSANWANATQHGQLLHSMYLIVHIDLYGYIL